MQPQIILTTNEHLQSLIEQSVRKAIAESRNDNPTEPNQLFNLEEAAEFIGVAKQTLYGYTSRRLIPFIKRGGKKILFERISLEAWLQEGKKDSISEFSNKIK